ncbi:SnoaL-like protein [Paraburkholderia sp. BL23I1N1]|uniref:nuclear transport factor 2 family protein n=1 Tax=Paraburkholderia sp. BL23I1N1 TaxID=1938802 RepID=UPI000E737756|nr:SnoaL-like protein [Paraburkholderia sp. BL23I1N1]
MTESDTVIAQIHCIKTVYEFFHCLDDRTHDQIVELFPAHGVWDRNGEMLEGRAAIANALANRPADRRTFHAVCNPLVELTQSNRATVHFYLTVYEAKKDMSVRSAPIVPSAVRRCTDSLVFDGSRWLIERKSSSRHLPFA